VTHAGIDTPIILLTARTQEAEKVLGLEAGADDYVTKPYSPRELRARVKRSGRLLTRAELAAAHPTAMTKRKVWSTSNVVEALGTVSPDGRYLRSRRQRQATWFYMILRPATIVLSPMKRSRSMTTARGA